MEKRSELMERYFEKPTRLKTWSGVPVKEIYGPEDVQGMDYAKDIGDAGEFPYTRGIHPNMYRGRLWSVRELMGMSSPRKTNERLRFLLEMGETALDPISDAPTMEWIDSDHPRAEGEVGVEGVPLSSLRDMEILLHDIPLDQASVTISSYQTINDCFYLALAEKQGIPFSNLRATFMGGGVYGRFEGFYACPIDVAARLGVDSILFCAPYPRIYPVNIGPEGLKELCATPGQEIGIDFCLGRYYIKEALRRGAHIDEIAPRISYTHRVGIDILEEVAKFRAARRVWAKMLKDEFGTENRRSITYKVHAVTRGSDLTRQQPEVNIIRVAYQALAAVLGGVQSLHTISLDEPLGVPTEEAHRIAVRTQQVLCYETGVVNVVDPLGGSYYVESLTNTIEEDIWKVIEEYKDDIVEAVGSGRLIEKLHSQSHEFQKEVESGERTWIGVNKFTIPGEEERATRIQEVDEEAVEEHLRNLKELKRTRDNRKVKECLEEVRKVAANEDENLYPAIIEASKAYATLGEIAGVIKMGYGYDYDRFGELDYPF